MEELVREALLKKTKEAIDRDLDWEAVESLWLPWAEAGDPEAQFQLAQHYFCYGYPDDDAIRDRMMDFLRSAAAQDHGDAVWLLASHFQKEPDRGPEFVRELVRAGKLGSLEAQRDLGAFYATGEWAGPKDRSEAARWYRLAADRGHSDAQYNLGCMLLTGEGGLVNTNEGLRLLELSAAQGDVSAMRLLHECYSTGSCGVTVYAEKAALYQSQYQARMDEYVRLNPPALFVDTIDP